MTRGVAVVEEAPFSQRWTKAEPILSHLPAARVNEVREISDASIGEPGAMSLFGSAVGTPLIADGSRHEQPGPQLIRCPRSAMRRTGRSALAVAS